jgi:3-deoxy-D-manno-octulosonic acid (KDO) 8-phosphate synthase
MDPVLLLALRNIEVQTKSAALSAKGGDHQGAAAEFAQAAMALGLQIGHFRAVLGPRYATSDQAVKFNQMAIFLATSIQLAFAAPAAPVEEEPEPDDHEVEHEGDGGLYGFSDDQE